MHVVIFEGSRWPTFAPLSLGRPSPMLATGISNLLDKQIRFLAPSRLTLWVRPGLVEYTRRRVVPKLPLAAAVNEPLDDGPALLVSARTLFLRRFEHANEPNVAAEEGIIHHALVRGAAGLSPADAMNRTPAWLKLLDLPQAPVQARMVHFLWDLIKWNEESLIQDYATMKAASSPRPSGPYHVVEEDCMWFGPKVRIEPGVVLDASKGPVMIDHDAEIGASSVLRGPCHIGAFAQIKPQTLIRPGTTIGAMCQVAGEVSNSIMFGCSNKSHYGYLGDSYVGKWVNLGAGTTTSNLKNTYGSITAFSGEGASNTGRRNLGSVIGDHAKTAIGTRLMAGTYLGFCAMVATSAHAPKFVGSFTFLTDQGAQPYRVDKAIEVMKAMFARRDRQADDLDEQVIRYVAQTAPSVEAALAREA